MTDAMLGSIALTVPSIIFLVVLCIVTAINSKDDRNE